jgi:hypothetical protein
MGAFFLNLFYFCLLLLLVLGLSSCCRNSGRGGGLTKEDAQTEVEEVYEVPAPVRRPVPPSSSPRLRALTDAAEGMTGDSIITDTALPEKSVSSFGSFSLPKQVSRAGLIQLRSEIGGNIADGEFPAGLEEALDYYWVNADDGLRRELLYLILNKPVLSREKKSGLRPWLLEQWFLSRQMNKREDLFLLEFLPRVSGASRDCISEYFRHKYKQNLGANYFAWKKVIEGGS